MLGRPYKCPRAVGAAGGVAPKTKLRRVGHDTRQVIAASSPRYAVPRCLPTRRNRR